MRTFTVISPQSRTCCENAYDEVAKEKKKRGQGCANDHAVTWYTQVCLVPSHSGGQVVMVWIIGKSDAHE